MARVTWLIGVSVFVAMLVVPAAPADTIAFVRDGKVYETTNGDTPVLVDGVGKVVDVAYDRTGHLYVTRSVKPEGPCDLFAVGAADPVTRFRDIKDKTDTFTGLCWIYGDPRGGLFFEGSNFTLGSATVFHLDPGGNRLSKVIYGYAPTVASNGRRMVVVQHRYFSETHPGETGSYETLALGTPGKPKSFRRIVLMPQVNGPNGGATYAAPSFAPDGSRIAAARGHWGSARRWISEIVVGRPGNKLRAVWRAGARQTIVETAWASDGRILALLFDYDAERSRLVAVSTTTHTATTLLEGVGTFAVNPR